MKTYVLCSSLEEDSHETLKKIKNDISLANVKLHIITVIEKQIYTVEMAPYIYPVESQYPAMEASALELLKTLGNDLGVDPENIVYKCFIEYDREKTVKDYLKAVSADLVVVATRGKHGLEGFFSSSFTDYLCKFSPCDVLVLRPGKH